MSANRGRWSHNFSHWSARTWDEIQHRSHQAGCGGKQRPVPRNVLNDMISNHTVLFRLPYIFISVKQKYNLQWRAKYALFNAPPFVNWYPNEIIDIHPFGVSDSQAWIYVRPAELIALPFLSLALRDPLEITIQYHFPASVAQRPVSGTLVRENYQLAQMKWPLEKASQNISPSLPLTLSLPLYFALPPSQFD